jgi:5-methyltetrahydropteroyltriglutamate--homocysteine methyltransferase
MSEFPDFDDVGSFPLPKGVKKEEYSKYYWMAYKKWLDTNKDSDALFNHKEINDFFIEPLIRSFKLKLDAGVEVINYPQHIDMYNQFLKPLEDFETEPALIEQDKAYILENVILKEFAKDVYEETHDALNVKLCITGPIELYIKRRDFTIYSDLALNYAKTVNRFLKNSIFNTKYIKTSTISIDEPSFGFVDLVNVDNDELITIFDKSLENIDCINQIHLHTLALSRVPLQTENIDILTCEYASDNSNVIAKKELDKNDKYIRVGITRTNYDNIMAETLDEGTSHDHLKTLEGKKELIDSKEMIEHNLMTAIDHYGDRLKFIGPDCGLSSWQPPELAFHLLKRTSEVIKKVKTDKNS